MVFFAIVSRKAGAGKPRRGHHGGERRGDPNGTTGVPATLQERFSRPSAPRAYAGASARKQPAAQQTKPPECQRTGKGVWAVKADGV